MRKIFSMSIILVALSLFLSAGDPLTIEKVEQLVLNRNQSIRASRLMFEAEKERVTSFYLPSNPSVGVMLDPMKEKYSGKGFMIYQKISLPLNYKYRGDAAKIRSEIYKHLFRREEAKILAEAKKAFYDYLYAHKIVLLFQRVKNILEDYVKIAKVKYRTGKSILWDPLRAEVEVSLIEAQIEACSAMETASRARLASLINLPNGEALGIPIEPPLKKLQLKKEKLLEFAFRRNPEIAVKRKEVELNKRIYALAKLELVPDFGIQIERRTVSGMWMERFMISIPLFFPFKEMKRIKSAKIKIEASKEELFNMKNTISAELEGIIARIKSLEKELEIYKNRALPRVREALKSAETGYASGMTDFLVLVTTEKQFLNLEMMYWKARIELGKSVTELERILALKN